VCVSNWKELVKPGSAVSTLSSSMVKKRAREIAYQKGVMSRNLRGFFNGPE
jgi:hypothetical protein